MIERKLTVPPGYDDTANPRVASFAAQFDDERQRLEKDTDDFEVRHLEWQPRPGMNTVGMLLAHLAIVEAWWVCIAPRETPEPEWESTMRAITGIGRDDDGMPLAPDGRHPRVLAGRDLAGYLTVLHSARTAVHEELRTWRDADLAQPYRLRDRVITREWTLYHVLEHFAAHHGQILLLRHMMRDAELLPRTE